MIEPMTITDFVIESNRIEGIERASDDPQLAAEIEATNRFVSWPWLTVASLEEFVSVCTGGRAQLRRAVGMNVRVGNHIAPLGGPEIETRLQVILDTQRTRCHSALETHCLYEDLHPFTDGNGRSGRVLWLWQHGGNAPIGFLHEFYYRTLDAFGGISGRDTG